MYLLLKHLFQTWGKYTKMLDSKKFSELNLSVSIYPVILIAGDWLLLSAGIFLLTLNSTLFNFLALLIILRQQLALSVMMHEGVHYSLAKNKKANDLIGIFFCSGPILSHFNAYRTLHMKHHRHALSVDDPGQYLLRSQTKKKKLILDVLKDLSGMTYFSLGKKANLGKISVATVLLNLAGQIFGMTLVWLIFRTFNLGATDYLIFWALPLVTLHQVILRVRALMEHGGFSYNKDATLCTRTVKAGLLTKILAPHNINFHIEHHLYPTIPSYRLSKISTQLPYKKDENYLNVWRFLFFTRFNK